MLYLGLLLFFSDQLAQNLAQNVYRLLYKKSKRNGNVLPAERRIPWVGCFFYFTSKK